MGSELRCKVRSNGKEARGKALLETNEIIFRGEMRLKIPLVSLKSIIARGGDLHLKWPEGSAVFELGDHAEKWAHKILHPKSTLEKLGIKPGLVISTLGMADGNFAKDVRRTAGSFSDAKPLRNSDLIFFGAEKAAELVRAGKLASSLASAGALWIVYPQRQAGDYGTAGARCRKASRLCGREGCQLLRDTHGVEVCTAESEARSHALKGHGFSRGVGCCHYYGFSH